MPVPVLWLCSGGEEVVVEILVIVQLQLYMGILFVVQALGLQDVD